MYNHYGTAANCSRDLTTVGHCLPEQMGGGGGGGGGRLPVNDYVAVD